MKSVDVVQKDLSSSHVKCPRVAFRITELLSTTAAEESPAMSPCPH